MSARLLIAIALAATFMALSVAQGSAATATFTVNASGDGSGRVTSDPAGIDCRVVAGVESGTCSATFSIPGTRVTVTAIYKPDPGSACITRLAEDPPPLPECTETFSFSGVDGANKVIDGYRFVHVPQPLTVSKTGDGSGKVTSSPAGIDCGATCSKTFDYGAAVTVTATPDAGAVFKQWTGACNGQGAICTLTITQDTSTNAVFDLAGTTTPTTPTTPATGASDTVVEVDVIGASAGKSRLGKSVVQLELSLQESISVTLTLIRKGTTLATKQFARVKEGERVLTLRVPAGTANGRATLRFELRDVAGNTMTGQRSVRIRGG